jgi:hypothetical protein
MTHVELTCHPDTPRAAVERIHVEVTRADGGGLALAYRLEGDIDTLRLPAPGPAERRDGLWRHTCCEAFVMAGDGPAYREFNLSPSGAWQAYGFRKYRDGGLLEPACAPRIQVARQARTLTLRADLATGDIPTQQPLRLGLSVVVESSTGAIAYWALRHTPGKPDFHHTDAFALKLA